MSCVVVDLLREGSLSTAERQRESGEEKKKMKKVKEGRHEDDDVDIRSEQEVGVSE